MSATAAETDNYTKLSNLSSIFYLFKNCFKDKLQLLLNEQFNEAIATTCNPSWAPLAAALFVNDEEKIKRFLKIASCEPKKLVNALLKLPDIKYNYCTTIWHWLAISGKYLALKQALKDNPGIDKLKDGNGKIIWHHLAESGNYLALKQALKDNPGIDKIKDNNAGTVWHYLALSGNYHALKQALKDNPGIDKIKDKNGFTIWHYLAFSGNYPALDHALKEHPEINNIESNTGRTIWHLLARSGNYLALCQALVEHPGIPDIKDNNGNTIWDSLCKSGYKDAKILANAWKKLRHCNIYEFSNALAINLKLSFIYLLYQYSLAQNKENNEAKRLIRSALKIVIEKFFNEKNTEPLTPVILNALLKHKELVISKLLKLNVSSAQNALDKIYKCRQPEAAFFLAALSIHSKATSPAIGKTTPGWYLKNLPCVSYVLNNEKFSDLPAYKHFFPDWYIKLALSYKDIKQHEIKSIIDTNLAESASDNACSSSDAAPACSKPRP